MTPNQIRVLNRLRDPSSRQCFDRLHQDGAYCALGHISKALDIEPRLTADAQDVAMTYLDLTEEEATEILEWNDGLSMTLPQIANCLEDLFSQGYYVEERPCGRFGPFPTKAEALDWAQAFCRPARYSVTR